MKRILLAAAGLLVAFALLGVALSGAPSRSAPRPIAALRHALAIDHGFPAPHPLAAAIRAASRVPALTGAPTVSIQSQGLRPRTEAAPTVGEVLTTTNGTWNNTPTSYTYAWEDCNSTGSLCVPALGSPTNTSAYVIVAADTSAYIQVTVTATNAYGSGVEGSALTGVVATVGGYTGSCTTTVGPTGDLSADINALTAGQTLCLTSGTYTGTNNYQGSSSDIAVDWSSGSSGSPITITAAPGATVTLVGGEYYNGSYVTVENLNLDVSNRDYSTNGGSDPAPCGYPVSEPIALYGQYITFQDDNIYGAAPSLRQIGLWLDAGHETIQYDKISDEGSCDQTQHLIYDDTGAGTVIAHNWMWDDSFGYCVQLYPSPGTTLVYSNVFDGCIDGTVDATSVGGDQTYHNVAANAIQDPSTDTGSPFTSGFLVNCLGSSGVTDTVNTNAIWNMFNGYGVPCTGVTATGNQTLGSNPFVNETAHNYSSTASALSSYSLWNGVGPPVPDPAPADPGFVDP